MRLGIVGASVRAAAQSAALAGCEVVAADLFADDDLRAVCQATRVEEYPAGLPPWLSRQDVDGWMYTGALENYPNVIDEMAAIAPLLGVNGAPLVRARDPLELKCVLEGLSLRFPDTLLRVCGVQKVGLWLDKNYSDSVDGGVAWFSETTDARYLQRFVPGEPASAVYAVSSSQAVLLGFTRQLVGEPDAHAGEWRYCGSIGPVPPTERQTATLASIGEALVDPLSLIGVVGVDLIVDGDELTVIEVNPRFPASAEVLERSTGRSVVAEHLAACRDERIASWDRETDVMVGKLVLFAARRVTVRPRVADWLADERRLGRVADSPREGESIDRGQPICTLVAVGGNVSAVRAKLAGSATRAARVIYR